jgi:hypothetical protein
MMCFVAYSANQLFNVSMNTSAQLHLARASAPLSMAAVCALGINHRLVADGFPRGNVDRWIGGSVDRKIIFERLKVRGECFA